MTEWYTLKIQYPISKEDIEIIHGNNKSMCWLYEHDGCRINHLDIEGHPESWLIPIEDKPITAEEAYKKRYTAHKFDKNMKFLVYKDGFYDGEKNQWINHDELRKLLEYWDACNNSDEWNDTIPEMFSEKVKEALKNLQPIEEIW